MSVASDGVTSGVQSALATISAQRAQQGNTTPANSTTVDSAQRTYQANLAYAAQNADQGSLLSKPLANGGLNASNTTTAAMQWAAQLNASNGQVTPLLFGNDTSAGGDAGGSVAVRTARTGVLVVDYVGKAGDVGVAFSKDQYMKGMSNAAKSATNFAKEGVQQANKPNGDWSFYNDMQAMQIAVKKLAYNNAIESVLRNDKFAYSPKMQYGNAVLLDGDKNPSVSRLEYNANQARLNSTFYDMSSNLSQSLPFLGGGAGLLRVAPYLDRIVPVLTDWRAASAITTGLSVTGQAIDTNGFTEGSYRLDKTLLDVGASLISMRVLSLLPSTSSLGVQYIANAGVSGVAGVSTSLYDNLTSPDGEMMNLTQSFVYSAAFGTAGKYFGQIKSRELLSTYTSTYADTIGGRYETFIPGSLGIILPVDSRNSNYIPYNQYIKSNKTK